MAQEIELSIMANHAAGLQPVLDRFEAEQGIRVRVRLLSWDSAWSALVKAGLYNDGPDVSEVGSTWLSDLVGMNALRPFNVAEVAALGKAYAFLPSAWKGGALSGDAHQWGIPWLVGARLLFYRPHLLEQAGIDPQTAFISGEHFEQTVRQLQAQGIKIPWTVPTGLTHTTLLNAASWVWGAGGHFIGSERNKTCFMEPEARAGLSSYFRLSRYLAPETRSLNGLEPDHLFLNDPQTAMTISGPWLFNASAPAGGPIAAALPPGPPFVGGSYLVVWKYSRMAEAAVQLVRYLTRTPVQVSYAQHVGLLPARLEALAVEPFSTGSFWQTAIAGLKSGRTFPTMPLWGLVEDRLTTELGNLWADCLANPDLNLDAAIDARLGPLARRLDALLGQG